MRTVELFEQAVSVAEQLGYHVRHEWLGGSGSGACEFCGRQWIFVDLALSIDEQLDQMVEALQADPAIHLQPINSSLRAMLTGRRAA